MPKLYDNIDNYFNEGINETLDLSIRADFCAGYFNLRGWKEVFENIDKLAGGTVLEGEQEVENIFTVMKMTLLIRQRF